jgi:hypothetical protein
VRVGAGWPVLRDGFGTLGAYGLPRLFPSVYETYKGRQSVAGALCRPSGARTKSAQ